MSGGSWVAIAVICALLAIAAVTLADVASPWDWLIPVVVLFVVLGVGALGYSRRGY